MAPSPSTTVLPVIDNFSWIAGQAFDPIRRRVAEHHFNQVGNEFARGRFTTNGSFTGNANTLTGRLQRARLPVGYFHTIESAVALARSAFRNKEIAYTSHDTYKMTPKLTVNLGLRWELYQPLKDELG
jgi:outer membrane receptor for monomeric catechols